MLNVKNNASRIHFSLQNIATLILNTPSNETRIQASFLYPSSAAGWPPFQKPILIVNATANGLFASTESDMKMFHFHPCTLNLAYANVLTPD